LFNDLSERRPIASLALALAVIAVGCGGGNQGAASGTVSAPVANPVDPATAGSVTGKIALEGRTPPPDVIRMNSDPNCERAAQNVRIETIVAGEDGALQNVFVYVKDGLRDLKFPIPATPVMLDQKGCRYQPHVLGVQVGQPMEIVNSDATLHNVHAVASANREFNTGQPFQGMRFTHTFTTKEVMVPFKCDVHNWMNAHIGVLDHPFFAVTGPDGTFALMGLPPGTYTIEAWHEKLGTQAQSITVGEKETKNATFTFKMPS
jgi:plastocyanin